MMACDAQVQKDASYWLEVMLQNWARWMRSDVGPDGIPKEACGGVTGYTHMGDSDAAYDKMDVTLAEATNAAIEGLEVTEQIAIYASYGVAAVWRYNRETNVLYRAKAKVLESLRRRGIWLGD